MITNNQFISTINNVVPFACSGRIVSRYLRNVHVHLSIIIAIHVRETGRDE